jgi:putative mRNA 3-end processing factor
LQSRCISYRNNLCRPQVKPPNVDDEIEKLNAIESNILLGVYGLTKARKSRNSSIKFAYPQKNVLTTLFYLSIHQLYQQEGISLGNYQHYDVKLMKQNHKNQIYIFNVNSYTRAADVVKIFSWLENLQRK